MLLNKKIELFWKYKQENNIYINFRIKSKELVINIYIKV